MAKRNQKVVLVGAKGFQRTTEGVQVNCFLWSQIGKIKNIRDYDTVILDLISLSTSESRQSVDWKKFSGLLDFHNTADILMNGGMIIVVGDPRFSIDPEKKDKDAKKTRKAGEQKSRPFLEWTGVDFDWDSEPGDTVGFQDDYDHRRFTDYVANLVKWEYSLAQFRLNEDTIGQHFNLAYIRNKECEIHLKKDFFCYNRYKNALAFLLRLQYCEYIRRSRRVLESYGPLIFLPAITLPEDDTFQLILSSICGIETDLPEPEWLREFRAPGQKTIDEEITRIEAQLQNTFESLSEAQHAREESRKCLKLLYEREYALEPVARDILRGLGAHVEDPAEKNKEDGWIVVKVTDTTYEGVLEIKSTRSDQFGEDGRKQLLDWIDRGRTLRGKNYKGIFIGNSAVDKPMKERSWAFSDSWTKAAELSGICAMKTENLYAIYLLKSRGEIDLDSFWKELFETSGIFDMTKYWEMLTPKDEKSSE